LQPFAWEAREFVRKKLIGKEVCFTVEYKAPGSGKEFGCIFLGKGVYFIVILGLLALSTLLVNVEQIFSSLCMIVSVYERTK